MIRVVTAALVLMALPLLAAPPVAVAQDAQPTVISAQYQPTTDVPAVDAAAAEAAATGGALAPDVTENPAENKSDITEPPPPPDPVVVDPAPPAAPAPPPVPDVRVEVGDGATNVAVTVRVGSDGDDGPIVQGVGSPRVHIPVAQVTPPRPAHVRRATHRHRPRVHRHNRVTAPPAPVAPAATGHTAYVSLTGPPPADPERATRPAAEREHHAHAAAPRHKAPAPAPVPPPWWAGSTTEAASAGGSGFGFGTGLALAVSALLLFGFALERWLHSEADGPPSEPAPSRLERPG
jgi:hypothetical protein